MRIIVAVRATVTYHCVAQQVADGWIAEVRKQNWALLKTNSSSSEHIKIQKQAEAEVVPSSS